MFDNPVDNTYSAEDAGVVFAAVLARAELLPVLREALCAEDFNPVGERPLWLALIALAQQGKELSLEVVARQLARQGDFSAAMAALPQLDNFEPVAPSGEALSAAVDNLRRHSRERQVVALLTELVEIGLAKEQDPDQAIAAIYARAARAVERQRVKAPPAAPLSARELLAGSSGPVQPLWLVERLLPAGGVSLLAGEVASGKTFLALDLAIAVAAGAAAPAGQAHRPAPTGLAIREVRPLGEDAGTRSVWGGRACLGGQVLYCCLDSSPRTIRGRVQALCAGRGIEPPEALFFDFSALNLSQPAAQQRLLGLIRDTRATLVVLDVLARYLPGVDENAVASVGPVFTLLRGIAAESGVSFLVVHHFNKSSGGARMQRVRGSSDIAAAVDAALSVTLSGGHMNPRRTVTPEKNRELPEEPPFDFVIETCDATLVLRFSEPQPPAETTRAAVERAHDLAMKIVRDETGELTRAEIEQRLKGAGFSAYVLNQLFTGLAANKEVVVGRNRRVKTYRWGGEG